MLARPTIYALCCLLASAVSVPWFLGSLPIVGRHQIKFQGACLSQDRNSNGGDLVSRRQNAGQMAGAQSQNETYSKNHRKSPATHKRTLSG